MITVLVDHNIEGQAALLWSTFATEGWLALTGFQLVMFGDVGLSDDASDRIVWRFVQQHRMLLLTGNRNRKDEDSLEQTIREENHSTALPVITIGSVDRMVEHEYRRRCASRLAEIGLYLEDNYGAGRLYIP
jgi:hypothetical protein